VITSFLFAFIMLFSKFRQAVLCLCCLLYIVRSTGQVSEPQQPTLQQFEPIYTFAPTVFSPFTMLHAQNETVRASVKNAQLLTLNEAISEQILRERPADIDLKLPYGSETLVLRLHATEVTAPDFGVITERSNTPLNSYLPGLHYRGNMIADPESSVAVSVTETGIMGLIFSKNKGEMVLGRLESDRNTNQYILYSADDMLVANPFSCGVDEDTEGPDKSPEAYSSLAEVSKCVRTYLECDNELFLEKGSSVQATVDYLLGMYNQVATLYQNEQITTIVSQIFIWTTPDPYSTSSSASALNDFRAMRTSFNGDLAHLVGSGGNNLGGIAYVDVLCTSYNYAFSDITGSYNTVPTYSWTVEVVTHEMGHNLGSNHTQWCGWQGGPIDNCVSPEGGCSPGPTPTNGGTIMSYCHLTGIGINFNNGFGTQPGNKIRVETSAATCVAASCPSTTCPSPGNLSIINITGSGATISWNTASGASSYTLRYRAVGASQWTTITSATSPYTISGLPANDEIEVTIQSVCGGSASDYRTGILFKTGASGGSGGGGGTTCSAPGNINAAPTTNAATITWSAVTGASSYQVSWKTNTSSTWNSPVSVSSTSYTINSLVASTTYNVRVNTVCSGGSSTYATTTFATTGSGSTCGTPGNLSANAGTTTANLSWSGVSGATSYQVSWKTSNATTWATPVSVSSTTYAISGLTASTTYNVRVNAVCNNGNSNFATATFTTTSGGGGTNCGTPTNLSVTPGASTAALTWTGVSGATSYRVQWKRTTTSSWGTPQTVSGTSATISGLFSSTAYNVRVAAICGSVISTYITTTFTTNASGGGGSTCNAPANFNATPGITDAALTWSAVSGAGSYTIQWKLASSSTWSGQAVVTGSAYTISNLLAATAYNARIATNCSSGASAFVTISFTTNNNNNGGGGGTTCATPTNLSTPVINTTTAAVSWQAVSGALSYNLQLKAATSNLWYSFGGLGATYINVQNLQPATTYQFRVQTNCANNLTSTYSSIVSFTTLSALPDGDGLSGVGANFEQTGAALQLSVAPNPTTDVTVVNISEAVETATSLRIINPIGRLVQTIPVGAFEQQVSVDMQGLTAGVYQIQLMVNGKPSHPIRIVRL
jgi:Metallo-peptidase family M12/Fibronectin type III domain/Secretion system C-terminal sorting domain